MTITRPASKRASLWTLFFTLVSGVAAVVIWFGPGLGQVLIPAFVVAVVMVGVDPLLRWWEQPRELNADMRANDSWGWFEYAILLGALAIIAGGADMDGILALPLGIALLMVLALAMAASALLALPVLIQALVVTALIAARVLIRPWRTMTWVLLVVNALFVVWIAQVIIELPRDCVTFEERAHGTSGPGTVLPASECPTSYWNDQNAQVARVVFLWFPVFAVLGLMWFLTRPRHSITQTRWRRSRAGPK